MPVDCSVSTCGRCFRQGLVMRRREWASLARSSRQRVGRDLTAKREHGWAGPRFPFWKDDVHASGPPCAVLGQKAADGRGGGVSATAQLLRTADRKRSWLHRSLGSIATVSE